MRLSTTRAAECTRRRHVHRRASRRRAVHVSRVRRVCVTQELRDVLLDLVDLAQTLQAADLREPEARELLSTIGRHAPRSGGGGGGLSADLSPSWARFMRGVEECESHLLTHARL